MKREQHNIGSRPGLQIAQSRLRLLAAIGAAVLGLGVGTGAAQPSAAAVPEDVDPSRGCTITGTAAADTLTGTAGDDVICGGGGGDTLPGGPPSSRATLRIVVSDIGYAIYDSVGLIDDVWVS